MRLQQTRVLSLDSHFNHIPANAKIALGVMDIDRFQEALVKIGFSEKLEIGEQIVPPASLGPVAKFNAEGREVIERDKPKETKYRQIYWTWKEWHGKDAVEKSGIKELVSGSCILIHRGN